MLAWCRREGLSRLAAVVVLCTAWGLPLAFPHLEDNDPFCQPARSGDAAGESRLTAATVHTADHCVICHAARQLRGPVDRLDRVAIQFAAEGLVDPPRSGVLGALALDGLPARAPPA